MSVLVAIPFHRSEMTETEAASLGQCARVFGERRPIEFIVPEGLDCSAYTKVIPSARISRFDREYFTSVSGYNRLLLTPAFYERYAAYEHLLIHQLDAWVFRDELDFWCAQDYDYVGAPFIVTHGKLESVIVGNGGFSLRRTSAMLRVLGSPERRMFTPDQLREFSRFHVADGHYLKALFPLLRLWGLRSNSRGSYLNDIRRRRFNSEDVVFHLLADSYTPDGLKMPSVEEAARFALDSDPARFFRGMPFGCHAWMKDSAAFWKPHISFFQKQVEEKL